MASYHWFTFYVIWLRELLAPPDPDYFRPLYLQKGKLDILEKTDGNNSKVVMAWLRLYPPVVAVILINISCFRITKYQPVRWKKPDDWWSPYVESCLRSANPNTPIGLSVTQHTMPLTRAWNPMLNGSSDINVLARLLVNQARTMLSCQFPAGEPWSSTPDNEHYSRYARLGWNVTHEGHVLHLPWSQARNIITGPPGGLEKLDIV